jgi:hypothetical protein
VAGVSLSVRAVESNNSFVFHGWSAYPFSMKTSSALLGALQKDKAGARRTAAAQDRQ